MKIKRYLDKDMRHVLQRVRDDQGPDAVILSNRRVDEGIEVIAALDYDEALVRHALGTPEGCDAKISSDALLSIAETDAVSGAVEKVQILSADIKPVRPVQDSRELLHENANQLSLQSMQSELSNVRGLLETQLSDLVWKDSAARYPMRAQVLRNLAQIGISPDVSQIILDRLGAPDSITEPWKAPLQQLAQLLPTIDDDIFQEGGTFALIGPTGVGKTTTIAKIAARFAMSYWADDIALVSADSYRIGAQEHLTAFANIIGTKVYSASSFEELSTLLDRLKDKKLVLIDTEGQSQRDRDLSNRLAAFGRNSDRIKFYLTLAATAQEAALDETIRQFRKVPLQGAIVTKIDEAAQVGCVMSSLIRNDLSAAWFSDGQRIPDDLHGAARKKLWLVNQALEGVRASRPIVDESAMAENYSRMGVANG